MLRLLKNEFIKMGNDKKFYIYLVTTALSIIAMAFIVISISKTRTMFDMNVHTFVKEILGGTVLSPLIPIFIILTVSDVITKDYSNGTMKFSLLTPIKKSHLILSKLIFICLYTMILLVFSFIVSYIVGFLIIGAGDIPSSNSLFISNIKCYLVSILPLFAFAMVLSLAAMFMNSGSSMIGAGFGIYFVMTIIDNLVKNSMYYTFTGGFSAWRLIEKAPTEKIVHVTIVACVYIILSVIINIKTINRKDILL